VDSRGLSDRRSTWNWTTYRVESVCFWGDSLSGGVSGKGLSLTITLVWLVCWIDDHLWACFPTVEVLGGSRCQAAKGLVNLDCLLLLVSDLVLADNGNRSNYFFVSNAMTLSYENIYTNYKLNYWIDLNKEKHFKTTFPTTVLRTDSDVQLVYAATELSHFLVILLCRYPTV
jgi:hypothetical protein